MKPILLELTDPTFNRYSNLKPFTKNGYSEYFKANDIITNKEVVIKRINNKGTLLTTNIMELFKEEVTSLIKLASKSNPYVINILDFRIYNQYCDIILEPYQNTLRELMNNPKSNIITENFILNMIKDISRGFVQLNENLQSNDNKIIHRNITPDNIVIKSNNNTSFALNGFTFSKTLSIEHPTFNNNDSFSGDFEYMAPEVICNRKYSHKSDIYSLGILCYECLYGKQLKAVEAGDLVNNWDINDKKISGKTKTLLQSMLKEERYRFDWKKILNYLEIKEKVRPNKFRIISDSDDSTVENNHIESIYIPELSNSSNLSSSELQSNNENYFDYVSITSNNFDKDKPSIIMDSINRMSTSNAYRQSNPNHYKSAQFKMDIPSEFKEDCFNLISDIIKKDTDFENITLNLYKCEKIQDMSIIKLAEGIKLLVNLENFELNLYECAKISGYSIIEIAKALYNSNIMNAIKLSFDFSKTAKINNDLLSQLGEKLIELPSLEEFRINLAGCKHIVDESVIKVITGLDNKTSLLYLEINLKGCRNLNDMTILMLAKILKTKENLVKFSLDLSECNKISDESIIKLSQAFEVKTRFNTFKFNLNRCEKITDKSLSEIAKYLQNKECLTIFDLRISFCYQITDLSIIYIANALKTKRNLSNFALDLRECKKITDKSIISLAEAMKNKKILKAFDLNLMRCEKISNNSISTLTPIITNMVKLSDLNLNLLNTQVSREVAERLRVNIESLNPLIEVQTSLISKIESYT